MQVVPSVPRLRVSVRVDSHVRGDGDHVLYWMTASRRTRWNHALDRAVALAAQTSRPLLVLEALRCDAPWASVRFHRFVIDGMVDNSARFAAAGVAYHPYLEPSIGAGKGLLEALSRNAVAVVADEWPSYFLPRMITAAAARCPVRFEAVDSNGLLPLRATEHAFPTAFSFRRHLQAVLPSHLGGAPSADPLAFAAGLPRATIPADVAERWPAASPELLAGRDGFASLPIDHSVGPVPTRGGECEGTRTLERFVARGLDTYETERDHPDLDATSGVSPYLHFGHVGAHQVLAALAAREGWTPAAIQPRVTGKREGWWGMRPGPESFLEQVVTWREVGFNMAFHRPDHGRYESLPDWARRTLDAHRGDVRPVSYPVGQLESASTHDPVWNAAQRQLVREGRMHNYLRMLWGKKILEWSASPEEAFAAMFRLNDRYALDGRDPNSSSGIAWCLGRYDRPWGPQRPVFGSIRYMSSDAAVRKLRIAGYLRKYGE